MFPHERSLVKKLADQPFALLGVNSDRDREKLKELNEKEQITWRSWFNGGTGGPISRQYGVTGWPTLHLIDHKGVVRHSFVGSPGGAKLDALIDEMIKEANAGS